MNVLKFGGTSVGSVERIKQVATLLQEQKEDSLVVLSAMSGTTNYLVDIAEYYHQQNFHAGAEAIANLEHKYSKVVEALLSKKQEEAKEFVRNVFINLKEVLSKETFSVKHEKVLLSRGELLSTQLMKFHFDEIGVEAVLLSALDFMRLDEDGEIDQLYLTKEISERIKAQPCAIYITQGFICRNAFGEIDNLKRGGSDYSASLIGAAIDANEIQIWTDIDGMHNNDPRFVDKTYPIEFLSFDEAAELAYFGAKILHPSSILPARLKNIPVRLLNTMDPQAKGTKISLHTEKGKVKSVAAKDNITAVRIRSGRMLMAYGFVRSVFEVFERYKTPVDLIATSEVAISVTIDDNTNLQEIIRDLKAFGVVETDINQCIVSIVGDSIGENVGVAATIFDALKPVKVRMISFGGSMHNVSLLVDAKDKVPTLKLLNQHLFNL